LRLTLPQSKPKCSNSKGADSRLKDAFCDFILFFVFTYYRFRIRRDDERESDDEMIEDTLKRLTEYRSAAAQAQAFAVSRTAVKQIRFENETQCRVAFRNMGCTT
jgi:hypothetical protein